MTHCKDQESSFLVLNTRAVWGRGLAVNVRVSEDGLQIRRGYEYASEREISLEELTGGVEVTDFAVGECGLIYLLDAPAQSIWIYDAQQKRVEAIPCLGPLFSETTTSITSVPGMLYVADSAGDKRVFALAEINWQIRWAVGQRGPLFAPGDASADATGGASLQPVDLAVDAQGNLYVLNAASPLVVRFDEAGRYAGSYGGPALADASRAAITLARDGLLYILDAAAMKVIKLDTGEADADGEDSTSQFLDLEQLRKDGTLPRDFVPSGIATDAAGHILVGDGRTSPSTQEDDRFIHRFAPSGEYLGEVAHFSGQVEKMVVNADDWIYVFSRGDEKKIFILRPELRFSKLEGTSLVKGRYFSKALDSADSETEWHKYTFDAVVPTNTQIQVSYLASDSKSISIGGTTRDLDAFLAAASVADEDQQAALVAQLDRLGWSVPVVNARDALINAATGRYLWLRIELIGSEQSSPQLKSLRVDFPRNTYLRYLPAVYQEDERSRDFLARFLSLFETFFSGLERQIDHIARYFDAAASTTSGEYLRWLASWLDIAVDKSWSEEKLRALVLRAPSLYKKRGTRAGLEELIEIFTGERPLIVEHFQRHCGEVGASLQAAQTAGSSLATTVTSVTTTGASVRTTAASLATTTAAASGGCGCGGAGGQHTSAENQTRHDSATDGLAWLYSRLYGDDPYCFCVLLKPFQAKTEEERKTIRRLLDAEKPAHTCAGMMLLQPWIHLDMHTYMGVNTYLSQPSAGLDLGGAVPRDTVLSDRDEGGQLERQSILGTDITLT